MAYMTSVWNILSGNPGLVVVTLGNMLVFLCFLQPRWKWWIYPVLVALIYLFLPMAYTIGTELFDESITYAILMACLGYLNDIIVLITFRDHFWKTVSLIFTLCILNRMFIFWGDILYMPLNTLARGNMDVTLSVVLVLAVMYMVISLVCWFGLRVKGRELIQTRLHHHDWVVLAGISVCAKLVIDFCSDFAFNLNPYSDSKIIWAMIALCTFSIGVLGLYLYSTLTTIKHASLKAAADRLTFEKDSAEAYYETQLHNQEALHRMKHDMNAHLTTVSHLLAEGNKDEAIRYLADLNDYNESHQLELYSDNPYLNAVLTNYASVFAENDIPFVHDIQTGRMELHHVEMCLALNNALQNALEASLKLPPDKRYVRFQVKTKHGRFLFRVTNRFDGNLMLDGELPRSTKEYTGHGYGLSSIRDAAESLGGFAVCKSDGDLFVLDVAM